MDGVEMTETEPVTIDDYEDIKAAIKLERYYEAKREDWSLCPTCNSVMKEDTMIDYGFKYKIMVCTNKKCGHWE